MNWQALRAIIYKDLKVVVQNKGVVIPIIVVPAIFLVLLPLMLLFVPQLAQTDPSALNDFTTMLATMPAGLAEALAGYSFEGQLTILVLVYFFAPLFLILPLMVSSVIAADSFAGEKERKTLEALLYSPTTDNELFIAKVLAAWLPAVAVAVGGFVVYGLVGNLVARPVLGELIFPNLLWLVLVFWVAPAVAGLSLGVTVVVSARAQGFQDAYQIGALIVLPLIALMIGQATGLMYFSVGLVFGLGLVSWLLAALVLWIGARLFQRQSLVTRL
ncbi:MAG: ABC transporter permease subunit [Ardenticatenales bacterium]|nr:ABC transporter permease subunit [Ardenticatenales bacterium]